MYWKVPYCRNLEIINEKHFIRELFSEDFYFCFIQFIIQNNHDPKWSEWCLDINL